MPGQASRSWTVEHLWKSPRPQPVGGLYRLCVGHFSRFSPVVYPILGESSLITKERTLAASSAAARLQPTHSAPGDCPLLFAAGRRLLELRPDGSKPPPFQLVRQLRSHLLSARRRWATGSVCSGRVRTASSCILGCARFRPREAGRDAEEAPDRSATAPGPGRSGETEG